MIVLDTSGLWAALDADQPQHEGAKRTLESDSGPFLLSPFVLAELDYLLLTRRGIDRESDFLRDVAAGAYELVRTFRVILLTPPLNPTQPVDRGRGT